MTTLLFVLPPPPASFENLRFHFLELAATSDQSPSSWYTQHMSGIIEIDINSTPSKRMPPVHKRILPPSIPPSSRIFDFPNDFIQIVFFVSMITWQA